MRPDLLLGSISLVFVLASESLGAQSADSASLARVRAALDRYRDPVLAVHDGYFSTLACMEYPQAGSGDRIPYKAGGMGVHFLNASLIGPQLDTLRPQVLIYEPRGDSLRLVAAEWFVPTAVTQQRPRIFGQEFEGPMEGHQPVMPADMKHWDLHVWLWKPNPSGTFSATNPNLHCPHRAYSFKEQAPHLVQP